MTLTPLYPSFKSLDDFFDVAALRALDEGLTAYVEGHAAREKSDYFLNEHRLDPTSPYQPGVREIWLSRTVAGTPYDYLDLDKPDLWQPTREAGQLPELMAFIGSLPFSATGRILIIYDVGGNEVPAHRDHKHPEICHEFIWLRTNFKKSLYMLSAETGERIEVTGHSAWFDSVNQYHGAEATDGLTFSIRVDGVFSDDLRRQIPFSRSNPAATPSVWANRWVLSR